MPCTFVQAKFAPLTADGTAAGLVTIASNVGWLPGAIVFLVDNDSPGIELVIVEQVGSTQLRLRLKDSIVPKGGGSSLTAYTVAQSANLNMEPQVVPVEAPFEARSRA